MKINYEKKPEVELWVNEQKKFRKLISSSCKLLSDLFRYVCVHYNDCAIVIWITVVFICAELQNCRFAIFTLQLEAKQFVFFSDFSKQLSIVRFTRLLSAAFFRVNLDCMFLFDAQSCRMHMDEVLNSSVISATCSEVKNAPFSAANFAFTLHLVRGVEAAGDFRWLAFRNIIEFDLCCQIKQRWKMRKKKQCFWRRIEVRRLALSDASCCMHFFRCAHISVPCVLNHVRTMPYLAVRDAKANLSICKSVCIVQQFAESRHVLLSNYELHLLLAAVLFCPIKCLFMLLVLANGLVFLLSCFAGLLNFQAQLLFVSSVGNLTTLIAVVHWRAQQTTQTFSGWICDAKFSLLHA